MSERKVGGRSTEASANQVILVEHLSKSYGRVSAVTDLSFHVRRGEIFGFLGPNGAGKTTTLSILEGLRRPDTGRVEILGMDIGKHAGSVKTRIGVQLQNTCLLPDLTVLEQMRLFAGLYGYRPDRGEIISLLRQVGLDSPRQAAMAPGSLSGGQRQRLALALALVNRPEIVFLDEPTAGLDPQSRRLLWDIVRRLRAQGRTIVLTTHYMEEAEVLCDRVGIINHGRLAALDTPGALIKSLAGVSSITTSARVPLEEIGALPYVLDASRDGALLRLQTRDVAAIMRSILDWAEEHEVRLNDLHIKQPGLEEVFLRLTGHAIQD